MIGYLKFFVAEANGTIPIGDAVVLVTDYDAAGGGDILYSLRTDADGMTPAVPLETPDVRESLSPGAPNPNAVYGASVAAAGYYPSEHVAVPVFAGITSVLPVNLLPLGEADAMPGAFERTAIYETPATEALEPGGLRRDDIGNRNGELTGGV